jgi:hypothetical protein
LPDELRGDGGHACATPWMLDPVKDLVKVANLLGSRRTVVESSWP